MITLNGVLIEPTIFPDKTSQVWKLDESNIKYLNNIVWDFESESEFVHLAQLKWLLDSYNSKCNLHIPFLPYGRQDKSISNDDTFAFRPFIYLLNSLNFRQITTLDAHSRVSDEYGVKNIPVQLDEIIQITGVDPDVNILFPDFGALIRYSTLNNSIIVEKHRDPATGRLSIESINLKRYNKSAPILMIDDICDGGGTFIMIADELKKHGINEYMLYTTHGIYSKGLQPLIDAGFTKICNRKGTMYEKV